MGLRHRFFPAIVCAAALLAGCVSPGIAPSQRDSGSPALPATLPANATFALPSSSGAATPTAPDRPRPAPRTLRDVVKPGATVVVTPLVLTIVRRSIEGTMVARVEEAPGPAGTLVVRVMRFSVPFELSAQERPARLTLPEGTLVRLDLRDPRTHRNIPVPSGSLRVGRSVSMRVRIGMQPGRAVVRVLSIGAEGSGGP